MAIRGAFSAGLIQGFATSMEKDIKDRQARMDELINNQMDTVKRSAPKLAQSMAEAKNAQMIMGEMKTQFGVTEEEFIALAQNYDINAVYGAVQKAQAALPEGSKLDKSQFLGSLKIPEGVSLPEGMTAEQAIESIYLGYARNVNEKPGDKSETHKNRSWGKALKDTLMLDPRASAEDQLKAMSYMGMPVNEIVQYDASQGSGYKPIQGVERVQGFDIKTTNLTDKDYESTSDRYYRRFGTTFADMDANGSFTYEEALLKQLGSKNGAEADKKLRKAGTAVADLERGLSQSGMIGEASRTGVIIKLTNEVDTPQEIERLTAAINDGTALKLIQESMQKNGRLTEDYIELILTGEMPSDDVLSSRLDTKGYTPTDTKAGSDDPIVNAILGNAAAEPEEEPKEPAPEPVMTAPELITEHGQDIITGLMDMGVTAEDGPEEFKQALADWFSENEGKLGSFTLAGSSVSIDMLADVFKRTFDNLAKQ
jgi:hypothetical protein